MKRIENMFVCFFVLFALNLTAQSAHLKKAKKLYKEKRYAEAIPHYEGALAEKDALSVKTKLANCYRLTNKMEKAEMLYTEIVQNEKARSKNCYYYAEALMSNGKYDLAKEWFLKYGVLEPEDEMAALRAQACDDVKLLHPYFTNILITEFSQNSELDDTAPAFYEDGIVFSSDRDMGMRLLKQKSGWTGRDYINLYFSKKKEDGSYDAPKLFSKKINELNKNTSNFSITKDGTKAVFSRNSHHLSKRNTFNMQLYISEFKDGNWKKGELVKFCNNEANYMHPCISPDGKMLFFVSDKGGGEGGTDIYVSKKGKKGWGRPENLGHQINTTLHEGYPYMHVDGKLFFCSKGHIGYGGYDIFFSEIENGSWKDPVNIGTPINSSYDDISITVSPNDSTGIFTSSRNGGDDDIYLFEISETPIELAVVPTENANPLDNIDENISSNVVIDPTVINPNIPTEKIKENSTATETDVVVETALTSVTDATTETASVSVSNEITSVKTPEIQVTESPDILTESTTDKKPAAMTPAIPISVRIPSISIEELDPKHQGSRIVSDQTLLVNKDPNGKEIENTSPPYTSSTKVVKTTPVIVKEEAKPTPTPVVQENKYEELVSYLAEQQLLVGSSFRLTEARYESNDYAVTTEIADELNRIISLMYKFPNLKIELGGHTSSLGGSSSNMELSLKRAEASVDYLINNGISKDRVLAKAYGEKFPLNHCVDGANCSPKEHNHNHRIELKVIAF